MNTPAGTTNDTTNDMTDGTVAVARGLSCYTAALHGYLAAEWDATAIIARSVRLAVRGNSARRELAFSHHEPALDLLPDGARLGYAAAASGADALSGLADEVARYGRAVVVVDSSRLPWSVTRGGPSAPHWLLVDGPDGRDWRVTDDFVALLPDGEQAPYRGPIGAGELAAAMTLPRWPPVHRQRIRLAFGAPVPVPAAGALWLRRHRDGRGPAILPAEQGWRIGEVAALTFLIEYVREVGAGIAGHLDDLWAAAGHHAYACRWRLGCTGAGGADRAMLEKRLAGWEALPRLLRLAVESAARGRPRFGLVVAALDGLRTASRPG